MLKAIRLERGLKQSEVAEKVGITQPTYSNIENGKRNPTVKTLRKIAKVLGVQISDLLDTEEEANL